MQALLLRPGAPAAFRRCVRDAERKILRTLVFEPGKPVILSAEDYAAVSADIGKALVVPQLRDGKPINKVAEPEPAESRAQSSDAKDEAQTGGVRRRR